MISQWKISNFKSILQETEINLAPLTIFAGANSSGKSSFIQSILLISQTLAYSVDSRSVVLNGPLTSLGQFNDLKSSNSNLEQISIKCSCEPHGNQFNSLDEHYGFLPKKVSFEISFDANTLSSQRELLQVQPQLYKSRLFCIPNHEDGSYHRIDVSISRSNKPRSENEKNYKSSSHINNSSDSANYNIILDKKTLEDVRRRFITANPVSCLRKHFLPIGIYCEIDLIQEDAETITNYLQRNRPHYFIFDREIKLSKQVINVLKDIAKDKDLKDFENILNSNNEELSNNKKELTLDLLDERLSKISLRKGRMQVQRVMLDCDNLFDKIYKALQEDRGKEQEFVNRRLGMPHSVRIAVDYIENYFSKSLKYLGPLRNAPKALYPLETINNPYDIGIRGENTASILELHKNRIINYIPSNSFKGKEIELKFIQKTLEEAIVDWLQYLGIARAVSSRDLGKLGHELKVEDSDQNVYHDLTHVGVGVSQVLPILVMCLLADTDSTLIFEQPELHLHPKVQTLLGDFFLSMSLANKQCILETHSEYLIDRIRFRIAASSDEMNLNNITKVYFVEKKESNSSFREVKINKYGAISDWPEGFFDQSQKQAEEILSAAFNKMRSERSKV